jgi:hypothetical protein
LQELESFDHSGLDLRLFPRKSVTACAVKWDDEEALLTIVSVLMFPRASSCFIRFSHTFLHNRVLPLSMTIEMVQPAGAQLPASNTPTGFMYSPQANSSARSPVDVQVNRGI